MEKFKKSDSRLEKLPRGSLSSRGMSEYMNLLELTEEELNNENSLLLDLGAGIQQNFAKEARELGLKSKIISVDPRLGLEEGEDLSSIKQPDKEKRIQGRKNAESNTIAALSDALPFKNESFNHVYAVFSIPYYLESSEEIEKSLSEIIRVLKPGGDAKLFPVSIATKKNVISFLDTRDDVVYFHHRQGEDYGAENDLFIINKK